METSTTKGTRKNHQFIPKGDILMPKISRTDLTVTSLIKD